MSLKYYETYLQYMAKSSPKEEHLSLLQNSINSMWDNTTQVILLQEQKEIGSDEYLDLDVRIDMALDLGTGQKLSDDYKTISFKDLNHETKLGLMYKYDNKHWITINEDNVGSPTKSIIIKKCNNRLRWVDPTNGNILSFPCSISYEIGSPQVQRDKEVNTPNNSMTLTVQRNHLTKDFETNKRFIFNGRPYRITGINNVLQNSDIDEETTILHFDLYLDVESPTDDLINNVANRYENNYSIKILSYPKEQVKGFTGKLNAQVFFNGESVNREVIWESNENATIDDMGNFELIGEYNTKAIIKAKIKGNESIYDSIEINILEAIEEEYEISISPLYKEIRQMEKVRINYSLLKNGIYVESTINVETIGDNSTFNKNIGNNFIEIECLKPSTTPLILKFNNEFATKEISIKLKPLF